MRATDVPIYRSHGVAVVTRELWDECEFGDIVALAEASISEAQDDAKTERELWSIVTKPAFC